MKRKLLIYILTILTMVTIVSALYSDDYSNIIYENDFESGTITDYCEQQGARNLCTIESGTVANGTYSMKCLFTNAGGQQTGIDCGGGTWSNPTSSNFTCRMSGQSSGQVSSAYNGIGVSSGDVSNNLASAVWYGDFGDYDFRSYDGAWSKFVPSHSFNVGGWDTYFLTVRNTSTTDTEVFWYEDGTDPNGATYRNGDGTGAITTFDYLWFYQSDVANGFYIDDIVCYTGLELISETKPPKNSSWAITSNNVDLPTAWNSGLTPIIKTDLLTGTVTTDTLSNGSCALDQDLNYTAMIGVNANYKMSTTGTQSHSFVLADDISEGSHCVYCSFIDDSGGDTGTKEYTNSSTGCLPLILRTCRTFYFGNNATRSYIFELDCEGNTEVKADLNVVSNFTGNNIYGEMYYANDTATTLTFASQETYYNLFMTNAEELNGMSFDGGFKEISKLTVQVSGLYSVGYTAVGDGQNNHEYHLVVYSDEEEHEHCEAKRKASAGGDIMTLSGTCFLRLTSGQEIDLRIADYSGTGAGNYYNGNLNLVRIGN